MDSTSSSTTSTISLSKSPSALSSLVTEDIINRINALLGHKYPFWFITDIDPDDQLFMIKTVCDTREKHVYFYHQDPQLTPSTLTKEHYKNISKFYGMILDLQKMKVALPSSPYIPKAISSSIKPSNKNLITYTDETGTQHTFNIHTTTFHRSLEGPMVRIFKYRGRIRMTTKHFINGEGRRWGNSTTFMDLYTQLQGPWEKLFPHKEDIEDSGYCYRFTIVHPELLCVSRVSLESGFLRYLGAIKIKQGYTKPPVTLETVSNLPPKISKPFIYHEKPLKVKEAHNFLTYGFYRPTNTSLPPKYLPGEAVVIMDVDDHSKCLHLLSESYHWRQEMRGADPSLANRLFTFLDMSEDPIKEPGEGDKLKLGELPYRDLKDIRSMIANAMPVVFWTGGERRNWAKSVAERKLNAMYNALMIFPLHRQGDIIKYFDYENRCRDYIVSWLFTLWEKGVYKKDEAYEEYPHSALRIIRLSVKFVDKEQNYLKTTLKRGRDGKNGKENKFPVTSTSPKVPPSVSSKKLITNEADLRERIRKDLEFLVYNRDKDTIYYIFRYMLRNNLIS